MNYAVHGILQAILEWVAIPFSMAHCRQILYQLSHQGSPMKSLGALKSLIHLYEGDVQS